MENDTEVEMGIGRGIKMKMKMKTESDAEHGDKGLMEIFETVDYFYVVPEGCIAIIISLTSPIDACRLSAVSLVFKSAAESDAVWERFLPIGYQSIISQSVSSISLFPSKKELYLSLCHNPILIDDGKKTFFLDKRSGKKCYMISARDLLIIWADTPAYWRWIPLPESRFGEVAELISVCWLEIRGKIDVEMLSPSTLYSAYIVFKATPGAYGFEYPSTVETVVGFVGGEANKRSVYLDPDRERRNRHGNAPRRFGGAFNRNRFWSQTTVPRETPDRSEIPSKRDDGWLEIELGEFFYNEGQVGKLEMSVLEVKYGNWKGGLVVEGIEIRPKGN